MSESPEPGRDFDEPRSPLPLGERPRPVLVVGAGPVGLTVTAELLRRGVDVRLVDRAAAASPRSKALLVWPRTLDVLRGLGGGPAIERHGLPVESFRYYSSARRIARIGFDRRTTPMVLPQPDVEALLTQAVQEAGGAVERGTVLVDLAQDRQGVTVGLSRDGVVAHEEFSYVVGCDGASSTVRGALGLAFDGATHPLTFMLVDARVEGGLAPDSVHYYCSPRGVLVMIGLPSGRFRVFTSAAPGLTSEDATLDLLQEMVDQRGPGGLRLHDADWSSTFSVHTRHAERFRTGRVFLAGDAAHIHSPAGGQGLNTGVTDAHNLAWKLALAWHGRAGEALLDSYEGERREVAAAVVRQADLQTRAWLITAPWQVALRDLVTRAASATRLFNRDYVPWLTGLRTTYQSGALVADGGRRSWRHAGRRLTTGALLPDRLVADGHAMDAGALHHTLLVLPGRQRSATVTATALLPAASAAAERDLLRVRTLDRQGRPGAEQSGRDAVRALRAVPDGSRLVLLRPDGHIAAQGRPEATADLAAYLGRHLRLGRRSVGRTGQPGEGAVAPGRHREGGAAADLHEGVDAVVSAHADPGVVAGRVRGVHHRAGGLEVLHGPLEGDEVGAG
jgi:2-polyprenyl-6-methoxyphenol hydroxylase-like FAD-dependent oxidoreductase